jgi:LysM repeat protein
MVSKLEKGIKILKMRQAMMKAGVPMSQWPSLPKYNTAKKASPVKKTSAGVVVRGRRNPDAPKYTWAPWGTSGVVHDNCYDYAFGSFSNKRTNKSVPGARASINSNGLTFTTCAGIVQRVLADNPITVKKVSPDSKIPHGYYKVMCFVAPSNNFGNSTGDFHWYKQISSVEYKIRQGDRLNALAKFFHVTPAVIRTALSKARTSTNKNHGRVANDEQELRVLNKQIKTCKSPLLPVGKVIEIPVALWSHKTGWAGGPLIVDASGKTITDPRKADRNYTPGFHYTKFCSAYIVKRGMAQTGNNSNRLGTLNRGLASQALLGRP